MSSDLERREKLALAAGILAAKFLKAAETCLTCENFLEDREICTKFNMRPPARIIAFGCPEYIETLPF